ncbi:RHH-type rel operon transcriptional repressor/antitoxin RelB [Paucibacter oligotrophus]|uniref:RHH-type rel operon transcriptional repressor/antitoxin RelB n=1 Tax=Roseateles oligotrophus TaxID=1769250 RepID=A0A840L8I2_9BURK|nr:CopG family transcriptional regulator [Roseateles oligotrophus]MBB4844071.1 RHH-type rel operon transcriptional repressor/antitoxin RelB [Roseateles oligotrophus]
MAVSVRMDPLLEKELEQAAKRQGVTKSQFIIDAVERALGRKDAHRLYLAVQEKYADYPVPTEPLGDSALKARLRAKHEQSTADWLAAQPLAPARPPTAKAKPGKSMKKAGR